MIEYLKHFNESKLLECFILFVIQLYELLEAKGNNFSGKSSNVKDAKNYAENYDGISNLFHFRGKLAHHGYTHTAEVCRSYITIIGQEDLTKLTCFIVNADISADLRKAYSLLGLGDFSTLQSVVLESLSQIEHRLDGNKYLQ